jgi:hypothetical protein
LEVAVDDGKEAAMARTNSSVNARGVSVSAQTDPQNTTTAHANPTRNLT